jgi:hypothetical protein
MTPRLRDEESALLDLIAELLDLPPVIVRTMSGPVLRLVVAATVDGYRADRAALARLASRETP